MKTISKWVRALRQQLGLLFEDPSWRTPAETVGLDLSRKPTR